jgi:hypothetical protein
MATDQKNKRRQQTKADLIEILMKMPNKYLGDGIHESMTTNALLGALMADRKTYSFNIDLNTIPPRPEFAERPCIRIGFQRMDFLSDLKNFAKEIGLYMPKTPWSATKLGLEMLTVEVECTADDFEKIKERFTFA